jgi:cytosine/adenosine deaminase-related metal-dependent hydrolase
LAESAPERSAIEDGSGPLAETFAMRGITPGRWPGAGGAVNRLSNAGGLGAVTLAAHCVDVTPADADALACAGVSVAHCPISNARLECGTAPLGMLEAAGVCVALGTDSPASAGGYDLRAEARACRGAHVVPPSARTLVEMMTSRGAAALGLSNEVGALRAGMSADLVGLVPGVQGWASDDPWERVLDSGATPTLVVCAGVAIIGDQASERFGRDAIVAAATEARQALC